MTHEHTPRLTRRQAAILSCFTGYSLELPGGIDAMHELAEELLGRPIFTHEFADPAVATALREAARPLILEIAYDREAEGTRH